MSIAVLLQHADTLITTPRDVAKLRQLILAQAVQGKLVPQEAGDEPAEVLLERILTEYKILVQSGQIKNKQNIEIFITSQYPQNWVVTTLSAVCTSVTDGDHLPPPKTNFGIPFLVIGNVRWGTIDFSECRYVSNEYYESLDSTRKPRLGDILYTLVGSFGIPVVVNTNEKFCVQRHIGIIRPSAQMNTQFLSYLLASNMFYVQAESIATGIAQKTVPILGLRKIPIPLPPLAEQRRIVARVDALMALCDQLEAQLQERQHRQRVVVAAALARVSADPTPANVATLFTPGLGVSPADLRQLILALAVQGKLVPQEVGDEVIQSIIHTKQNEVDEFHPKLPDSWAWVEIGQITELINGRAFKPEDWGSVGLPIIRIQNLNNPEAEFNYYAGEYDDKHLVIQNDLLFSWSGTPGTSFGAFIWQKGKAILNQHIFRCIYNSEIYDVEFLRLAMNSKLDEMIGKAHGAVGLRHITKGKLQSIKIPLPPLAEQRRIVARVDALMALVDQLEAQQAQASALGAQVLDAVVGGV